MLFKKFIGRIDHAHSVDKCDVCKSKKLLKCYYNGYVIFRADIHFYLLNRFYDYISLRKANSGNMNLVNVILFMVEP